LGFVQENDFNDDDVEGLAYRKWMVFALERVWECTALLLSMVGTAKFKNDGRSRHSFYSISIFKWRALDN
jgi:hypothetical protein